MPSLIVLFTIFANPKSNLIGSHFYLSRTKTHHIIFGWNLEILALVIGRRTSLNKKGWNLGHGLSDAIKLETPEPKFLQSGRKTDLQPIKQNLCLAPDQKMVRPKKVANDLKIDLAP